MCKYHPLYRGIVLVLTGFLEGDAVLVLPVLARRPYNLGHPLYVRFSCRWGVLLGRVLGIAGLGVHLRHIGCSFH